MLVVPVLDLMRGVVVRGVGGRRDEYRAIHGALCPDSNAPTVARAISNAFGCRTFYLADLDAIAGAEPSWPAYAELLDLGLDLWVDCGVDDHGRARRAAAFAAGGARLGRVIVGLESIAGLETLARSVAAIGHDRLVFSLDMKEGRLLSSSEAFREASPIEVARRAIAAGVRRMIVLDLADVGTGGGTRTLDLCRAIRASHPHIELTAGGGVRGADDLRSLAAAGCQAALVASALHDGRLTRAEIEAVA